MPSVLRSINDRRKYFTKIIIYYVIAVLSVFIPVGLLSGEFVASATMAEYDSIDARDLSFELKVEAILENYTNNSDLKGNTKHNELVSFALTKANSENEVDLRIDGEAFEGTLTFDDGPHPSTTPLLVEKLLEAGVRDAVFFFVGYRMLEYPELVSMVVDAGFRVGYHSMFHQNLARLSKGEILKDIKSFKVVINEVLGHSFELALGRPPFGGMSIKTASIFHKLEETGRLSTMAHEKLLSQGLVVTSIIDAFKEEGLELMLWNVDFDDWERLIDLDYAAASHSPGVHQIWLMHERPVDWRTYRTFDNQLPDYISRLLTVLKAQELNARKPKKIVDGVNITLNSEVNYPVGAIEKKR